MSVIVAVCMILLFCIIEGIILAAVLSWQKPFEKKMANVRPYATMLALPVVVFLFMIMNQIPILYLGIGIVLGVVSFIITKLKLPGKK